MPIPEMFAGPMLREGGVVASRLLPAADRERYAREARKQRYAHGDALAPDAPPPTKKASKKPAEKAGERWVTINGGSGKDGDGGTRIRIDGKGNITAGPKALRDAGITKLKHFGGKGKGGKKGKPKKASKPEKRSAEPKKDPRDNLIPFLPLDKDPPPSEEIRQNTPDGDQAAAREEPATNLQHWREALSKLEPAQRKSLLQRFTDWWQSLMKAPDTTEYEPGFLGALQRVAAKTFHAKDAAERERYQKDPGAVLRYAEAEIERYAKGDPPQAEELTGKLRLSSSGWLLLDVPDHLAVGAWRALDNPRAQLPFRDGKLNTHISVMRPEEIEQLGGPEAIEDVVGQEFSYQLGEVKTVEPDGWDAMERVWFVECNSPALEDMRESLGLSRLPKEGKHRFHITFAVQPTAGNEKYARSFEPERYAERWITLNGDSGEDGNGGTPVKVDDDGAIVAGPDGLAEKGVKHLDDLGGKKPKAKGEKKPKAKAKTTDKPAAQFSERKIGSGWHIQKENEDLPRAEIKKSKSGQYAVSLYKGYGGHQGTERQEEHVGYHNDLKAAKAAAKQALSRAGGSGLAKAAPAAPAGPQPSKAASRVKSSVSSKAKTDGEHTLRQTGKLPHQLTPGEFFQAVDPSGARFEVGYRDDDTHLEWVRSGVVHDPDSIPTETLQEYASKDASIANELTHRQQQPKAKQPLHADPEVNAAPPTGDAFHGSVSDIAKSLQNSKESSSGEDDIAPRGRGDRFGSSKVFIGSVWRKFKEQHPTATREEFDKQLVDAHRAGKLTLSRADMVAAMHPDDVAESEINPSGVKGASEVYHFIRTDRKPRDSTLKGYALSAADDEPQPVRYSMLDAIRAQLRGAT